MSYRTTPNFKRIISAHNKKILHPTPPPEKCNCQRKNECPMKDGLCREKNVVYKATVVSSGTEPVETYIGMTAPPFKERYGNHKKSFKHQRYSTETALSGHIYIYFIQKS